VALQRKSIRLNGHERALLVKLYRKWRIPVDQFDQRPSDREEFTAEWHRISKRHDSAGELVHYMKTQRKRSLWVRLDGNYDPAPAVIELSAEEIEELIGIFRANVTLLDQGEDVLSYDDDVAEMIAKEFEANTGRRVPANELVAKLTALRKRGLLPRLGDLPKPPEGENDVGFTDII
jgi:hypothetical protein